MGFLVRQTGFQFYACHLLASSSLSKLSDVSKSSVFSSVKGVINQCSEPRRIPWKACSLELGTSVWKHGFFNTFFHQKNAAEQVPSATVWSLPDWGTYKDRVWVWLLLGTGWCSYRLADAWSVPGDAHPCIQHWEGWGGGGGRGGQQEEPVIDISTLSHPLYISALYQDTCQDLSNKCLCAFELTIHCIVNAQLWPSALMAHTSFRPWAAPRNEPPSLCDRLQPASWTLSSQHLPGVSLSVLP